MNPTCSLARQLDKVSIRRQGFNCLNFLACVENPNAELQQWGRGLSIIRLLLSYAC